MSLSFYVTFIRMVFKHHYATRLEYYADFNKAISITFHKINFLTLTLHPLQPVLTLHANEA